MQRILIQLDTDSHPSTFDRVVAIDAGVEQLFSYGNVTPDNVTGLVHGAMFTRGPKDLHQTAIFIGGSDVRAGDQLLEKVSSTFFPPLTVSVLMDSNGSNTTAAAAVRCAERHLSLKDVEALVLGGTGPVGMRSAQILAEQGARVRVASRSMDRAKAAVNEIKKLVPDAHIMSCESSESGLAAAVDGIQLLIAAGAAGVQFLTEAEWEEITTLKVAIDLNAVAPVGIEGIDVMDSSKEINGVHCYGAIGVGGLKMKVHKTAVAKLFESNDQIFNTAEIFSIARSIDT